MIGKALGQYKILEELGRGGMGVVYKARDANLDRTVALKFLPSHVSPSEQDIARFTQEAKAAAALNHPNVCTIYDIKEIDNLHFIVMELVEGVTIRRKIAEGPLPIETVLTYGLQIADALQEAHGRGIVHRDIKADNIMLNRKNQVKVMDFGLAKLKGSLKLTKSSSTVGTLAYMAPEQIQGGEVDARSDIFSLGVVLYEMLTAHTPFRGEHEAAMMYSILNEAPAPVEKYLPDAPGEMIHVLNRALEKNPDDRYQTINEMAIDLRRMKKDSSRVSRPTMSSMPAAVNPRADAASDTRRISTAASDAGTPPATAGSSGSHRTTTVTLNIPSVGRGAMLKWVLPGVVIVAGIIGYFTFFTGGETDTSQRIPVAVADFQNQTKEDDLNGLSGMLITSLEQSRRLSVMTRSRMFDVLKQLGKPDVDRIDESIGREICRQSNVGALVVASVSKFDQLYIIDMKVLDPARNEYLLTLKEEGEGKSSIPGMIDRLAEKTRLGLKEKAADVDANSQAVAEMTTPSMEAYQAYFAGEEYINKLRFDSAAAEFRRAVTIDSTFAVAHYRLAYALQWNGAPGAPEAIAIAMRYVDRVPKKESYLIRGEDAIVRQEIERGLAIYRELLTLYPDDKEATYLVGDYSFHKLDFPAAEAALTKVIALDPAFSRAYTHLAWTYMFGKRFREMREVSRRYVVSAPSQSSYLLLAESFLEEGMLDSALAVCGDALEIIESNGGIESFQGSVYLSGHQFGKAASVYRSLVETPGADPARIRHGLTGLVTEAVWSGKYREALRRQDRLIEFESAQQNRAELAVALASRAHYTVELMGDTAEARTFLSKALELKAYGEQSFQIALQAYYIAAGDFDRSAELARTGLAIVNPEGVSQNDGIREYRQGNYGSAIRSLRGLRIVFHDVQYVLAKSYAATDQPDSALAMLSGLRNFYSGLFNLEFGRALYDARGEYLAGVIEEKRGVRRKALEHYETFLGMWKDADAGIPELIDAKKRNAALKGTVQP